MVVCYSLTELAIIEGSMSKKDTDGTYEDVYVQSAATLSTNGDGTFDTAGPIYSPIRNTYRPWARQGLRHGAILCWQTSASTWGSHDQSDDLDQDQTGQPNPLDR